MEKIKKKRTYELPETHIEFIKEIANKTGDSQNVTLEMIIDFYKKHKDNKIKTKIEFKPCAVKYGQEV
jgi:hypothetical protein